MRKPALSLAAVEAALAKNWKSVADLTPIVEGEESQACSFRQGTQEYILRINRAAAGFQKDALAYRRFASGTLPIPEIVEIGETGDGHAFCISRRLPGVTLQNLPAGDLPRVLAPTAGVMSAIAESSLDGLTGFGPFDPSGRGSHGSWREFLTSIADGVRYDWNAVNRFVPIGRTGEFQVRVTELAGQVTETRCLVHGDFGSNNVLTDGCCITGVLDWSEAMIGDPLYDIANIFFWRTRLGCMEQQARFFEARLPDAPRLGERLLCYQLRIGLSEIYENALNRNPEALAWALLRCDELAGSADS